MYNIKKKEFASRGKIMTHNCKLKEAVMNNGSIGMSVKRFMKKTVALAGLVLCASSGFALQQDGDGFYIIADSSDWSDFATLVKTMPTAKVKMVSDIDLEGSSGVRSARSTASSTATDTPSAISLSICRRRTTSGSSQS